MTDKIKCLEKNYPKSLIQKLSTITNRTNSIKNSHILLVKFALLEDLIKIVYGTIFTEKLVTKLTDKIKALTKQKNIWHCGENNFFIILENTEDSILEDIKSKLYKSFKYYSPDKQKPIHFETRIVSQKIGKNIEHTLQEISKEYYYAFSSTEIIKKHFLNNKCSSDLDKILKKAFFIKEKIQKNDVCFFYQPVTNSISNQIEYYELLLRIKHKDDYLPPGEFIEFAEKFHLSKYIDEKVFELFKQTIIKHPKVKFAFNLTSNFICNDALIIAMNDFFLNLDFAKRTIIEITETSEKLSSFKLKNFIKEHKKNGIQFAIDDFGSGYTNFKQLNDFDFDIIKIDGDYINNIKKNEISKIFVKSCSEIGRKLGIKIVAEHVKSKEIKNEVSKYNVDFYQGFYISKPQKSIF